MQPLQLDTFLNLIQNQFNDDVRLFITVDTNIKTLKEWSSLQTMIIVNEVDKAYNVILTSEDFQNSTSIKQLFQIVQTKLA